MIPFHPFAEMFELIEGSDFSALVDDIRANGLHDPIVVFDGKILDGRNRYRASLAAGILAGDDAPEDRPNHFKRFVPQIDGDPLSFVVSKNIHRRHLTTSQRAYAMAEYETLRHGGARNPAVLQDANLRVDPETRADLAERGHVSERSIASGATVRDHGVDELKTAVRQGAVAISDAEQIARKAEDEQRAELQQRGLIDAPSPHMASRKTPPGDFDYAPTPPFATRALFDIVLPKIDVWPDDIGAAWDPAQGEGHMTGVFDEYPFRGIGSDIFDYAQEGREPPLRVGIFDFLTAEPEIVPVVDWIITNPPFNEKALEFALRALEFAKKGVALFVQLRWLETVERYQQLFQPTPPTIVALFVERVPLKMGVYDPDGSTATAYCWVVWKKDASPQPLFWIPNICRAQLSRPGDRERFTAHPVLPIGTTIDGEKFDPETGEITVGQPQDDEGLRQSERDASDFNPTDGGSDVKPPEQSAKESHRAEAGEPSGVPGIAASDPTPISDAERAHLLGTMSPSKLEERSRMPKDDDLPEIPDFLKRDRDNRAPFMRER